MPPISPVISGKMQMLKLHVSFPYTKRYPGYSIDDYFFVIRYLYGLGLMWVYSPVIILDP